MTLALALALGCSTPEATAPVEAGSAPQVASEDRRPLRVAFQTRVDGEIEPCG